MNLTLIGCEWNWSSVVDEARVFMDLDGEWALSPALLMPTAVLLIFCQIVLCMF